MLQCPVCFKLIEDRAPGCPRCGWRPGPGGPWRAPTDFLGSGDADEPGDRGIGALLVRAKGLLVVVFVLVLVGVVGRVLVVQNRAAHASWVVQSQLLGWKEDRRKILRKALNELQQLHAELLDAEHWDQEPAAVASWRQQWRQRLNQVKATYQLTGQVRFGDLNVRTEEALHNLVLYLSSLERDLQERTPEQTRALEQSIRRAFRAAEKSLR